MHIDYVNVICDMNNIFLLTYLFSFSQIGTPQSPSYTPMKRDISDHDYTPPAKRGRGRPRGRGRGRGCV